MRSSQPYMSRAQTRPGDQAADQQHQPPPQTLTEIWPFMVDMVESKVQAAELRTDNKLADLKSEISSQTGQLIKWIIGTGAAGVFAILGLMVAILAYGGDRFDGGIQGASLTVKQSEEARRLAEQNSQQVKALTEAIGKRDGQIEALIKLIERRNQ